MDRLETLKTIVVLSIACLIGSFVFHAKWLVWVAVFLLAGGSFGSFPTNMIARYWVKFGKLLGKVNSTIIMTVLFYLVVTPFSMIYRFFNRKEVGHFIADDRKTTFEDVKGRSEASIFDKVW